MLNRATRWVVLGLAVWAGAAGGDVRAESPEGIFRRANAAYEAGRYDEAAQGYRSLIEQGFRDPRLEYDLGNAEFRLGRLGVSILHFERARRLAPTDPEIAANLALARSMTLDEVVPDPLPAPLRILEGWQDRVGPDLQAWIALGLFWAVAGVVAMGLSEPGRWRGAHGWVVAGLLALLLATGLSWWFTLQRLEGRPLAVVLAPSVEVRAGPGESNPTVFTIHEGLTVEIRSAREDWVQVSLPNRLTGWLSRDAIERI